MREREIKRQREWGKSWYRQKQKQHGERERKTHGEEERRREANTSYCHGSQPRADSRLLHTDLATYSFSLFSTHCHTRTSIQASAMHLPPLHSSPLLLSFSLTPILSLSLFPTSTDTLSINWHSNPLLCLRSVIGVTLPGAARCVAHGVRRASRRGWAGSAAVE